MNARYIAIILITLSMVWASIGFTDDAAKKNAAENAALRQEWESWNAPVNPFRLIGNIYYVGPAGISSFLIVTPAGNILLDTGFATTVPRIRTSIEQLGFKLSDIKLILNSHAHLDHAGGDAEMKRLTGAKLCMSAADAALLASGGTNDFTPYSREMIGYPPAQADEILHDGQAVTLGGVTLTCHLTPGHTKGCCTWTMSVTEAGQVYHVLFFGSTSLLPGVSLLNNTNYPNIVTDYEATFRTLRTLPCDVFLAPHAGFFDLPGKMAQRARSPTNNPFVNPHEYKAFLDGAEKKFRSQLAAERAAQTQP